MRFFINFIEAPYKSITHFIKSTLAFANNTLFSTSPEEVPRAKSIDEALQDPVFWVVILNEAIEDWQKELEEEKFSPTTKTNVLNEIINVYIDYLNGEKIFIENELHIFIRDFLIYLKNKEQDEFAKQIESTILVTIQEYNSSKKDSHTLSEPLTLMETCWHLGYQLLFELPQKISENPLFSICFLLMLFTPTVQSGRIKKIEKEGEIKKEIEDKYSSEEIQYLSARDYLVKHSYCANKESHCNLPENNIALNVDQIKNWDFSNITGRFIFPSETLSNNRTIFLDKIHANNANLKFSFYNPVHLRGALLNNTHLSIESTNNVAFFQPSLVKAEVKIYTDQAISFKQTKSSDSELKLDALGNIDYTNSIALNSTIRLSSDMTLNIKDCQIKEQSIVTSRGKKVLLIEGTSVDTQSQLKLNSDHLFIQNTSFNSPCAKNVLFAAKKITAENSDLVLNQCTYNTATSFEAKHSNIHIVTNQNEKTKSFVIHDSNVFFTFYNYGSESLDDFKKFDLSNNHKVTVDFYGIDLSCHPNAFDNISELTGNWTKVNFSKKQGGTCNQIESVNPFTFRNTTFKLPNIFSDISACDSTFYGAVAICFLTANPEHVPNGSLRFEGAKQTLSSIGFLTCFMSSLFVIISLGWRKYQLNKQLNEAQTQDIIAYSKSREKLQLYNSPLAWNQMLPEPLSDYIAGFIVGRTIPKSDIEKCFPKKSKSVDARTGDFICTWETLKALREYKAEIYKVISKYFNLEDLNIAQSCNSLEETIYKIWEDIRNISNRRITYHDIESIFKVRRTELDKMMSEQKWQQKNYLKTLFFKNNNLIKVEDCLEKLDCIKKDIELLFMPLQNNNLIKIKFD